MSPKSRLLIGRSEFTPARFPGWSSSLRVVARRPVSGGLSLDGNNRVVAADRLLKSLNARIGALNEGPRGLQYLLTDAADGKIPRLVKG